MDISDLLQKVPKKLQINLTPDQLKMTFNDYFNSLSRQELKNYLIKKIKRIKYMEHKEKLKNKELIKTTKIEFNKRIVESDR